MTLDTTDLRRPAETSVPLEPLIAERWSTRAFREDVALSREDAVALFEAARWAPSHSNSQTPRFLLGLRGDLTFAGIAGALNAHNRAWAVRASALVVGLVHAPVADDVPATRPYDLGLAVGNLVVQAGALGLHVRQMAGFDPELVRTVFDVPEDYRALITLAIGRRGPAEALPEPLRAREEEPRSRRALADVVHAGTYGTPAFPPVGA